MKLKFLVLRGRKIVFCLAICIFGLLTGDLMLLCSRTQSTVAVPLSDITVLVDPGHGGFDSGASANGVVEKDLNLEVAKILQEYIESAGGTAYLTRNEDRSTAVPENERHVSMKMSDLKERKKAIDNLDADVFVSIHMNKFEQTKYKGAQVFFDNSLAENKRLAENIQQALMEVVDKSNNRSAKGSGKSIFVLRDNIIPSVLVECGFLSNTEEAKKLADTEYQRKLAWGIYTGIVRYFSE